MNGRLDKAVLESPLYIGFIEPRSKITLRLCAFSDLMKVAALHIPEADFGGMFGVRSFHVSLIRGHKIACI